TNDRMSGSSRIQRSQYGSTVLTWVCWSMISETQIAYGSRVLRQGRSREWDKNQSSKRPVSARGFAFGRGFLETIPLWGLVLHTVDPGCCCIARGKALGCRNFVVKPLTSYTCKLSDEQASLLKSWLQAHGYKFREVTYARFAAEKEKTNLVFYESGK